MKSKDGLKSSLGAKVPAPHPVPEGHAIHSISQGEVNPVVTIVVARTHDTSLSFVNPEDPHSLNAIRAAVFCKSRSVKAWLMSHLDHPEQELTAL